jgi:hypothetical protein
MSSWKRLEDELNAWATQGHSATLWWRDDDAISATPPLTQLLRLSQTFNVPVSLAVIPRGADGSLVKVMNGHPQAAVLQHGWAHVNHAPPTSRKAEFGPHRPLAEMLNDLRKGWETLRDFVRRLPVFVAPWNRMDSELVPALPQAGLRAVSTLGPRTKTGSVAGVKRVNVHVDIIDWKTGPRFAGEDAVLTRLTEHLQQRRLGTVDADEPTGIMTHHQDHDAHCWAFMEKLLARTRSRPEANWLDGEAVFFP